ISRRNSANLFALEKSRTTHFHLPSYKFQRIRDRIVVSDCRPGFKRGIRCLRCGLRRKDPSWTEIDAIVNSLSPKQDRSLDTQRHIQSKLFGVSLRIWMTLLKNCSSSFNVSNNFGIDPPAHLSSLFVKELLYRQKAERLAEELQQQRNRRHGYVPTASPSLVGNKDRFGGLLDEYSRRTSPAPLHPAVYAYTATAIFKFDAKSPRELSLNRGEIVRITREVDANWLEGERNGRSGLFPRSYVQLDDEFDRSRCKAKAVYPFTSRRSTELSLKMDRFGGLLDEYRPPYESCPSTPRCLCTYSHSDFQVRRQITKGIVAESRREIVRITREVDANWLEGERNGRSGLFPRSYVQVRASNISNRLEEFGQLQLDDEFDRSRCKAKAVYPFTSRRSTELSLKMGELVTLRREIDENWLEGTNHLGEIGIFPRSYVRLLEDIPDDVNEIPQLAYSPDRPKTPKGELVTLRREIDENWLEGTNHLGEIGIFPRSYVRLLEDIPDDVNEIPQLAYSPDRPKTPKVYEKDAYRDFFDLSSTTHNSEPTSFSRDSGFVDNRLSQTSSSVR
ncbi:SH3 domain protein, partial [Ostertagia ostertagi]